VSPSTRRPTKPIGPRYFSRGMAKNTRDSDRDKKALEAFRKTVGQRMDQLRRDRDLEAKQLYGDLGWDKGQYSRKYRGHTPLDDEDVVKLRRLLRAPTGWPYVSVEEGLLIDATKGRAAEMLRHLPEILKLLDEERNGRK
jgi:hypothetical protein